MALTRPTIQNINTNLTAFTDSLTVTNFGNVANRDIGEVFDRSQGGGSNVASFWQESTNSFAYAYTSSTGLAAGNLSVTSYANLILNNLTATGNITAGNLIVSNVVYQNSEYITTTETVAGNSTVNGLTVNTSVTIGTSLSVSGNVITGNGSGGIISGANVISANYFIGNGAGITYVNAANVSGTIPNASFSTTAGTVTTAAQPNITSVGTLTGLTLSGSLSGTAIYASTFGNNGANFTGNVFSAATTSTETLLVTTSSNLGAVGTITITGGSPGYVIKTDGAGTLSWGPDLSGGITYTANTAPPTSGNLVGDQWFSTVNDVLYEYSYDGVSYYWVDISSTVLSANLTPQDILNPFLLMGA